MKPLKIIAISAEAVVIAMLAISSYNVAFGGRDGINWMAGAPIIAVVALECLRIPTALNLVKAGVFTMLMSFALIAGLSVITMEAASIGFENLIFERTRPVVEAERDLEKVMIGQRTIDKNAADRADEIKRLTADLDAARTQREVLGDQKPELQPMPPNETCSADVGIGKHAQRASWNCNSQVQKDTANANKKAQEAHAAELKTATEQVTDAEKRLAATEANKPDTHVAVEAREAGPAQGRRRSRHEPNVPGRGGLAENPCPATLKRRIRAGQALGRDRALCRRGVLHVNGGGHLVNA